MSAINHGLKWFSGLRSEKVDAKPRGSGTRPAVGETSGEVLHKVFIE